MKILFILNFIVLISFSHLFPRGVKISKNMFSIADIKGKNKFIIEDVVKIETLITDASFLQISKLFPFSSTSSDVIDFLPASCNSIINEKSKI